MTTKLFTNARCFTPLDPGHPLAGREQGNIRSIAGCAILTQNVQQVNQAICPSSRVVLIHIDQFILLLPHPQLDAFFYLEIRILAVNLFEQMAVAAALQWRG